MADDQRRWTIIICPVCQRELHPLRPDDTPVCFGHTHAPNGTAGAHERAVGVEQIVAPASSAPGDEAWKALRELRDAADAARSRSWVHVETTRAFHAAMGRAERVLLSSPPPGPGAEVACVVAAVRRYDAGCEFDRSERRTAVIDAARALARAVIPVDAGGKT